jgi:hypothetical protein
MKKRLRKEERQRKTAAVAAERARTAAARAAADTAREVRLQRYCHVYQRGELEALFKQCYDGVDDDNDDVDAKAKERCAVTVVDSYWDAGNFAVVFQKD